MARLPNEIYEQLFGNPIDTRNLFDFSEEDERASDKQWVAAPAQAVRTTPSAATGETCTYDTSAGVRTQKGNGTESDPKTTRIVDQLAKNANGRDVVAAEDHQLQQGKQVCP